MVPLHDLVELWTPEKQKIDERFHRLLSGQVHSECDLDLQHCSFIAPCESRASGRKFWRAFTLSEKYKSKSEYRVSLHPDRHVLLTLTALLEQVTKSAEKKLFWNSPVIQGLGASQATHKVFEASQENEAGKPVWHFWEWTICEHALVAWFEKAGAGRIDPPPHDLFPSALRERSPHTYRSKIAEKFARVSEEEQTRLAIARCEGVTSARVTIPYATFDIRPMLYRSILGGFSCSVSMATRLRTFLSNRGFSLLQPQSHSIALQMRRYYIWM